MNVAIVVAGGQGTRFGGSRPKQFLELHGVPIIIHTLRRFEQSQQIERVVVVLPPASVEEFQSLIEKFALKKISRVVVGGETRAQSVRNGLAAIDDARVVAVHDAVRPLVDPEEIDAVVATAAESGAAILVAPVSDTIKQIVAEKIVRTVSRSELRRALTPQAFHFQILKQAYQDLGQLEAAGIDVTDDSFLVERLNVAVTVVEGSARNVKITTPEDLAIAEALLERTHPACGSPASLPAD
jgi:2-C-methyl-D-erythritol 4-phosphate cytidylyltransferase